MALLDATLEGTVQGKPALAADKASVGMTVVGVKVKVPRLIPDPDVPTTPGTAPAMMLTPLHTPVRRITLEELADNLKFDGRDQDGFDGATAIVEGTLDTDTNILAPISINIQPAENLLLGSLSATSPVRINGVQVKPINDTRMEFEGYFNEFGFKVKLSNKLINKPATAEGYFSAKDNIFYAQRIELDSSADLVENQPPVSVTRTRVRRRPGAPATLDLRGGVDFGGVIGNTFRVAIYRVEFDPKLPAPPDGAPRILIGVENATRDPAFPSFGFWRLKGPLSRPPEGFNPGEPEVFPLTAPRFIRVVPWMIGFPPEKFFETETDVRFV